MLLISDLPAGDYDLLFKKLGVRIRLQIAAGEVQETYVLGSHRQLELRNPKPLQIKSVAVGDTALNIALVNASDFSACTSLPRVTNRPIWVYDYLGRIRDREPWRNVVGGDESFYAAGRKLGDEYRYIIDRRYAAKFPGNMLERPSLLLNPWAIRGTETGQQLAQEGEAFGAEAPAAEAAPAGPGPGEAAAAEQAQSANLDFLAHSAAVLVNLVPDENRASSPSIGRRSRRTSVSGSWPSIRRTRPAARSPCPRVRASASICGWPADSIPANTSRSRSRSASSIKARRSAWKTSRPPASNSTTAWPKSTP